MPLHALRKVQTPAIRLRRGNGDSEFRFGAHNFVAVMDAGGRVVAELHGIARGPNGSQLRIYGGLIPFRREVIWGERFDHQTGFYDPGFPQADLFTGADPEIRERLRQANQVLAAVNARQIAYPWPAPVGANSNAYYATLIAGMALPDVRIDGELWAPSSNRLLLDEDTLHAIRAS